MFVFNSLHGRAYNYISRYCSSDMIYIYLPGSNLIFQVSNVRIHCMVKNLRSSFLVPGISTTNATKKLVCSCGKSNKEGQELCVQDTNRRKRCPCIGRGVSCSRDCRCKGCQNKQANQEPKEDRISLSCKCEVDKVKTDKEYVACIHGKRTTKCPCMRKETQCGSRCLCKNCGNCD